MMMLPIPVQMDTRLPWFRFPICNKTCLPWNTYCLSGCGDDVDVDLPLCRCWWIPICPPLLLRTKSFPLSLAWASCLVLWRWWCWSPPSCLYRWGGWKPICPPCLYRCPPLQPEALASKLSPSSCLGPEEPLLPRQHIYIWTPYMSYTYVSYTYIHIHMETICWLSLFGSCQLSQELILCLVSLCCDNLQIAAPLFPKANRTDTWRFNKGFPHWIEWDPFHSCVRSTATQSGLGCEWHFTI